MKQELNFPLKSPAPFSKNGVNHAMIQGKLDAEHLKAQSFDQRQYTSKTSQLTRRFKSIEKTVE